MNNRYKIPHHISRFVKIEIQNYKRTKKELAKLDEKNSLDIIRIRRRLEAIERVFDSLNAEDREAAEIIFFSSYTQQGAEIARGISKAAYYNARNKIIYLVAREMELV